MTLKTLSTVAVRIIGWLIILEGVKSFLNSVILWMMRAIIAIGVNNPSHTGMIVSYLSVGVAVVIGVVEIGVGCLIIQHSEYWGRILCKGIDERL